MPKRDEKDNTFLYWLGVVAHEARSEYKNITPEFLAPLIGVNNTTLRRFEQGTTWPRNIDIILQAYAELGGYEDSRALVAEAVTRWTEKGRAHEGPHNFSKLIALLSETPGNPSPRVRPVAAKGKAA